MNDHGYIRSTPMITTSKSPMGRREPPLIAFALTLGVLIGGGVLGYHNVRRMVSNERRVAHTDRAIVDLEAAYSGVRGAEAGQRSYLLTGDSGYLQPYQAAVGETQYELTRLQAEFKSMPAQQQRLLALKETIGRKLADLNRTIRTGEVRIIGVGREVEGRRRDGSTFALELAVKEFELGAQPHFTAILRDITERKRLEQQNREMMNALKESDRHKDEFLALLAHELRGPLAPLRNCLELLKLGASDENLRNKVQGTMERQLAQMVRLVNDLLDLGRVSCGQIEVRREPVELGSLMRHAADACAPLVTAAGHVLSIVVPPEPESIYVDADPARLAQVFGNLLQNACKYTEPGGRIEFSAGRQAGRAVVRVKDSGIGIAPGELESIFGLFVQVSRTSERAQGGLGIGLALVKRLIELHGGSIEALSAGPGAGSEFIVRLPLRPYVLGDAADVPPVASRAGHA